MSRLSATFGIFTFRFGLLLPCLLVLKGGSAQAAPAVPCLEADGVWRRALCSSRSDYFKNVYRARVNLWSNPLQSIEFSQMALRSEVEGNEAHLLLAHATLLSGNAEEAHRLFEKLLPQRSGDTKARRLGTMTRVGAARAALLSGSYQRALFHYRRAVLTLAELTSARERARVLIETATAASYASLGNGREARTALRLAEEEQVPFFGRVIESATALSFLRDGMIVESRAAVRQLESSWKLFWLFEHADRSNGLYTDFLPVLPRGEEAALCFAAANSVEPEAAPMHWKDYLLKSEGHRPSHHSSTNFSSEK